MSEETATPATEATEANPSDFVSVNEDGGITLSPEAEAIMEGREPEVAETTPEPPKEEAKETPKEEPKPKRKIKHNGVEVEVEPDQEESLISMGFDYTKKTQALAEERNKLAPYSALIDAMNTNPDLNKKIVGILKGETPKEQPPQFDDPIEQVKWEAKQEALKEAKETIEKPLKEEMAKLTYTQAVNAAKAAVQADPMKKEVEAAIIDAIKVLPESIGRPFYDRINYDPQAYLETYQQQRAILVAKQKTKESEKPPETEEEPPKPTKRETHAPILESGGKSVPEPSSQKEMNARIKELTRRSKAGDFQALGELLELRQ
jgi:hypothetical protein